MEASFSAFHQKLRRCFSDFEALLVAHINTTSSSPNQSPLSLIESSSISLPLSSLNLHSPAVQFVARSLTVPTHICVYSNSPQTPAPSTSRPAVRTAAAFNFTLHPHTPTVNPLFPPHPQTTHIPRALASKIPQIQEIIFDLDSLGVDFFCNHAHPPLISTPVSQTISTDYFFFYLGVIVLDIHRFPPRSFAPAPSLYLKISNAKPILFGPAITSWNEEPPGSLCLELNPPLKSLLVGFIKSDMEMIPWVEEPPGSWFRFMLLYQDEESGEPESAAVNLFLEQLWSYTCCSKGPYYFGFKADKFFIHDIVDALYKASLYARVNGEVMPDQLESQVEPAIDISVGDELWTAPIISVSITEIAGVVVSFDSKLIEVDWITHPVQKIRSNHHLEDKVVLKALGMIHPSVGPQSTPSMEP